VSVRREARRSESDAEPHYSTDYATKCYVVGEID